MSRLHAFQFSSLRVRYTYLLRILIASLDCLPLWNWPEWVDCLHGLVFWYSIENRFKGNYSPLITYNNYPNIPRNSSVTNFQNSSQESNSEFRQSVTSFVRVQFWLIPSRFSPRSPFFPVPSNSLIVFACTLLIGVSCIGRSDNHWVFWCLIVNIYHSRLRVWSVWYFVFGLVWWCFDKDATRQSKNLHCCFFLTVFY